jgi:hypothetical protein
MIISGILGKLDKYLSNFISNCIYGQYNNTNFDVIFNVDSP